MSDIEPQVGDVWSHKNQAVSFSTRYWTVAAIKSGQVCLYMIDNSGNMSIMGEVIAVEDMQDLPEWELVERDGKPYKPPRVFEDGAHYPVIYNNNHKVVKYCHKMKLFYESIHEYYENDLYWIGPKLEIEWPDQEVQP